MESKAITDQRAEVAFHVSMLMLRPAFNQRLAKTDFRDADGGIPMVVAGGNESAIVTLHRLERCEDDHLLLASMKDGRIRVASLSKSEGRRSSPDAMELVGGMTVWDWMGILVGAPEGPRHFYSDGSDVMPTSVASEYAV